MHGIFPYERDPEDFFPGYKGVDNLINSEITPLEFQQFNRLDDAVFSKNHGINSHISDVISAYAQTGIQTDPLGMYTGRPDVTEKKFADEFDSVYMPVDDSYKIPVQDADDL